MTIIFFFQFELFMNNDRKNTWACTIRCPFSRKKKNLLNISLCFSFLFFGRVLYDVPIRTTEKESRTADRVTENKRSNLNFISYTKSNTI